MNVRFNSSQIITSILRPLVIDATFAKYLPLCRSTSSRIPFTFFKNQSILDCRNNEPPGAIVTIRHGSEKGKLLGMGFYDPEELCVETFHWETNDNSFGGYTDTPLVFEPMSSNTVGNTITVDDTRVPVPDVRYFHNKIMTAFRKRQAALNKEEDQSYNLPLSNCARIFHGAADGIPSLYINVFGSIGLIVALSPSSEQLVPLVESLLYRRMELSLVFTYTPTSIFHPKLSLGLQKSPFVENSMLHFLPSLGMPSSVKCVRDALMMTQYPFLPLHHRDSRKAIMRLVSGKRVLLIGDEEATIGSLTCVCGLASRVVLVVQTSSSLRRIKERFFQNYSDSAFNQIQVLETHSPANEQESSSVDIVLVGGICSSDKFEEDLRQAVDIFEKKHGTLRGTIVVQCGANSLGVHRPSRGGVLLSPRKFIEDFVKKHNESNSKKPHRPIFLQIDPNSTLTNSTYFPCDKSVMDGALLEWWDTTYYDVVINVVEALNTE